MSIAEDIVADFDKILIENGDFFTVKRQTTTEDNMGNVTNVTEADTAIYAIIRDITKKDRKIHEMGLAVPGNRLIYVKAKYETTSAGVTTTTIIVKEDDILIDRDDKRWRIVKILHEKQWTDVEVYKKAIVTNINLDGSA